MATTWLSQNPSKRWNEIFVLCYTPIWTAIVAWVQFSGILATWGDGAHMAIGIGLAAPLWLVPWLRPGAADRMLPYRDRHAVRFGVWIAIFTFLQVYFGSMLFFDVLGMEYHFNVTLILNRSPLFLYPLTIAYFSTYYVVMQILWRAFRSRFPATPPIVRFIVLAVMCYAVAFTETAGMATEAMHRYFLYRDKQFTLLYGSLCYGTLFLVSMPFIARIDETPDGTPRPSLKQLVWEACAENTFVLVCYEAYAAIAKIIR